MLFICIVFILHSQNFMTILKCGLPLLCRISALFLPLLKCVWGETLWYNWSEIVRFNAVIMVWKLWFSSTELHGIISQKAIILIVYQMLFSWFDQWVLWLLKAMHVCRFLSSVIYFMSMRGSFLWCPFCSFIIIISVTGFNLLLIYAKLKILLSLYTLCMHFYKSVSHWPWVLH
jgi:hypothetical protein